jgi:hypothetical protein
MCTTYKPVHQKIRLHWRKRLHTRLLGKLHKQHFEGWTVVSVPAKHKNTKKRQQELHTVIALWASPTKCQIITVHHEWWLTVTFFVNGGSEIATAITAHWLHQQGTNTVHRNLLKYLGKQSVSWVLCPGRVSVAFSEAIGRRQSVMTSDRTQESEGTSPKLCSWVHTM